MSRGRPMLSHPSARAHDLLRLKRRRERAAQPKEADSSVWERRVTTCIVASSFERKFVSASDTRMSFSGMFSVDDVVKVEPFHGEWNAMIGGSDVSQATAIIERATKVLRGKGNGFSTVMTGFKQAYREQYREVIADSILPPSDMTTLGEFKRDGKRLLNETMHRDIALELMDFSLGCVFLVYGYDSKRQPHIFEVRNPGKATIHDKPGFWAIGKGATSALAMLALLGQGREVTRFPETIYNVLAAKYASETASDVGPKTFFMIHEYGSVGFSTVGRRLEEEMRELWKTVGRPRVPDGVASLVEKSDISFWPKRR